MIEVSSAVQKQPYLNYNEQRALESIILNVVPKYPAIGKIVLYGSKARGNFTEESDIDLLFVTEHALPRAVKFDISDAIYEAEVEYDVVVSAVFVTAQDFSTKSSPFLRRARSEGTAIWSRE
jgi:predicted nucleotidyltransferase